MCCVVAVRNPCHKTRGSPRHPALTASQFCGHATGVDPHREDAGPIFLVPEGLCTCSQRPARRTTGKESSLLPADSTIPSAASSYLNDVTTSSPPVRIQAPCVDRKIATRLKRDGAESLGFVGGLRTTPTQRTTKAKTYFVFNDIDLKRVEGSSALIGEHTSSTPFRFHLGAAQRRPNCRARIGIRRGSLHESALSVRHLGRSMNGLRAGMAAPPLMAAARVAAGVTSLTCQEPTFTGPLPNRRSRPTAVTRLRPRRCRPMPHCRHSSPTVAADKAGRQPMHASQRMF